LEKKHFDWFNYGSLIIIAIMLALMIFKLVPQEWFMPLLVFGIFLMAIRVILRIKYMKSLRNKERS
jgi:uncharacterized membrane protein (DUF4010 family)